MTEIGKGGRKGERGGGRDARRVVGGGADVGRGVEGVEGAGVGEGRT